ncbi:hypothetical protein [Streptomyces sp. NPDC057690]
MSIPVLLHRRPYMDPASDSGSRTVATVTFAPRPLTWLPWP